MRSSKRFVKWLIAAGLLAVVVAGWQYELTQRQLSAIARLEKLGGRVVTTSGEPRWLRPFLQGHRLKTFQHATVVNLRETAVTDEDLRCLLDLKAVQRLNLSDTLIGDTGLRHLKSLHGLKALDLNDTRVTNAGLAELSSLRDLEYLYLARTHVSDDGLKHLRGVKQLRQLDVSGTPVTEAGLQALRLALPQLEINQP